MLSARRSKKERQQAAGSDTSNDQAVFNRILPRFYNPCQFQVLPQELFPSGGLWRRAAKGSLRSTTFWVHANYRMGSDNKRRFLTSMGVWQVQQHATLNCTRAALSRSKQRSV